MIGLPTETADDAESIALLCKQIKQRFLKSSRIKKNIGKITVSINPFIPKPFTPFQWAAVDDLQTLKNKIKIIKDGLKRVANIRVHTDNPRRSYIQALFSRGDRKIAQLLMAADRNSWNWTKTLKESALNPDGYVIRERSLGALLPWDFIEHGIDKSYLIKESKKGREEKTSPACKMDACGLCGVCG